MLTRKIKIENEMMSGYVEMTIPNYNEKMTMAKKLSGEEDNTAVRIDRLIQFGDDLKKRITDIKIGVSDGAKKNPKFDEYIITSIDELEISSEGLKVINDLILMMINGVPMGKLMK